MKQTVQVSATVSLTDEPTVDAPQRVVIQQQQPVYTPTFVQPSIVPSSPSVVIRTDYSPVRLWAYCLSMILYL